MTVQVAIFGGGPAGIAAAAWLSQRGVRVLCIDSGVRRGARREVWTAAVGDRLQALALEGPLSEHAYACRVTLSSWGTDTQDERYGLFNAHGDEWIVTRPEISSVLRRALTDSPAEFREGARLRHIRCVGRRWRIDWDEPVGRRSCIADAWIDATGVQSAGARRVGARRLHFDRQLGLSGRVMRTKEGERMLGALMLETGSTGWWYMIGGDAPMLDAVWMTDMDLLVEGPQRTFHTAFSSSNRLGHWAQISAPNVSSIAASLSCLDYTAGDGWCAVGDAALQRDPLCGAGAYHAVNDGISGAETVLQALRGDASAWARHQTRYRERLEDHLRERWIVYGSECRWPMERYWFRRSRVRKSGLVDPERRWNATSMLAHDWERSGLPLESMRAIRKVLSSAPMSSLEMARCIRETVGQALSDAWIVASIGRLEVSGCISSA